jgi:hypothetical protein
MANNALNEYIAAELSEAAYLPVNVFDRNIDGWKDVTDTIAKETGKQFFNNSEQNYSNEFRVFVNDAAKQVVIAFKGSKQLSNWVSDINPFDQGFSAYQSIADNAQIYLNRAKEDFVGYTVFTDGHSLGGGMAQSFAVQGILQR